MWLDKYGFWFDVDDSGLSAIPWTIFTYTQASQVTNCAPILKPLMDLFSITFKKLNDSAEWYSGLKSSSETEALPKLIILGLYFTTAIHLFIYSSPIAFWACWTTFWRRLTLLHSTKTMGLYHSGPFRHRKWFSKVYESLQRQNEWLLLLQVIIV